MALERNSTLEEELASTKDEVSIPSCEDKNPSLPFDIILSKFQLQQYKLGGPPPSSVPVEDKPKENGQVDSGDQINNIANKVSALQISFIVIYLSVILKRVLCFFALA